MSIRERLKKEPGPSSSNQDQTEIHFDSNLPDKLKKLQISLEKSFKPEFIESILYLIRIECQDQASFDSNLILSKFEWEKLDYFVQQLKKISKNKTHLFMLINKMLISNHHRCSKQSAVSKTKNAHEEDLNDPKDYLTLINDYNTNQSFSDYFSLTNILVRFLFKLFKLRSINFNDSLHSKYSFDLSLLLLSCLADLCYYEEIRIQVLNDSNLKCFFEIFALVTRTELEINQKINKQSSKVQLIEKFWSKMCRLGANLCQEKTAQKIKSLFSKDFMQSLCKCLDQQQQQILTNLTEINSETDIDLYHSLLRFIKYACELLNCRKILLENRVLVHLCKYMYKLNKNVTFFNHENDEAKTSKTSESLVLVGETSQIPILLNKKFQSLFKDLIKQYLIVLDNWPSCSEFYNQIIEGNTIEHLLWIQTADFNYLTNHIECSDKSENSNSSLNSSNSFNYSEFSFNLMYKFCRDYHACRAEFGRVGGLSKYIQKADQMTSSLVPSINKEQVTSSFLKEYTKLIDILSLSCKESANRLRLKEQGFLTVLIKLQQKLKSNKDEINKYYKTDDVNIEDSSFIDSTLYNKLLVALCCFAHDQDSMNILLNNGLIESLLAYLNEIINKENENQSIHNEDDFNFDHLFKSENNKNFSLKKLLSQTDQNDANSKMISKSKKRKTIDSCEFPASKPKRANSDLSYQILSPSSPTLIPLQQPESYTEQVQATSPTESYLSMSPNFIPSPQINSRCSSAQIFQGLSPNFYSSLSPTISMNELAPSPSYFNSTTNEEQEIELMNQIKFSPSINNESSCYETSEDEQDIEEENKNELEREEVEVNKLDLDESKKEDGEVEKEMNQSQSIESINHVEACVFYVLSQLSHGDKPTPHLIQNFDSIINCLLNYLKKAKVRNPRALRILNRLTKNQYCFSSFLQTQFPYKLKNIFFTAKKITKQDVKTTRKTLQRSKSLCANLSKMSQEKKESDIEKEMSVYLNSNKAFFDASSSFPSFESIEFTLINNLKSQCISSSDSGYLSLISMMKQKKSEKLSCALVAPFILRNSKALCYIMLQLNGIDLILDTIFNSTNENSNHNNLKFKSISCINKILSFINYKRDLKQIRDFYETNKRIINEKYQLVEDLTNENKIITFFFNLKNERKELKANSCLLSKKSDYFKALIDGHFTSLDLIEIKEVSYEVFSIIIDMLKCRHETIADEKLNDRLDIKINFDLCIDLIMASDRFFLNDFKDFFISILINKFISLSNFISCFKLAWYLNNSFLSNSLIDFLLSEFQMYTTDFLDSVLNQEDCFFIHIFKHIIDTMLTQDDQSENSLVEYFKKTLKYGLSEIIKNNNWKF